MSDTPNTDAEAQSGADTPFTTECVNLGRESASAGLRMDRKAPNAYREAFLAYQGPRARLTYFEGKVLSLRLSAIRRGMLVDSSVTAQLLERITDGKCPVTLERLRFGGGQSVRNPSVDRLVNEVSYRAGNICMLSQRANRAKADQSFEDVAQLAQSGARHGELESVEWMRLASLMYGAWARAHRQSDPYLLPLAAIPGRGMFMSTSQVVQLLLTRHFGSGGSSEVATSRWMGLTQEADCAVGTFLHLRDLLADALKQERHAGDAWLHGDVFEAFVDWYGGCKHVVAPAIEALLTEHQGRADDTVVDSNWLTTSRYQH
jgi:hypothetical protein